MAFKIRFAEEKDTKAILDLIIGLAKYEKMEDEVIATEDTLREWIFEKGKAEVLLAEEDEEIVGFALFFHNFSTFVGRAGLYLEDLFVYPQHRGKGYGKALLRRLAQIAMERKCGRFEWVCLNWNQPSIDFYLSVGAQPVEGWTIFRMFGDSIEKLAKSER